MSKPIASLQKKIDFVPTYHHCCVVGHIRPNCSLLRQDPKPVTWAPSRNIDVLKFVLVCYFCDACSHIRSNYHKLKFKNFLFQFRTRDHVPHATSPKKLFGIVLKISRFLSFSKKFILHQIHFFFFMIFHLQNQRHVLCGWENIF